jgi:hypothetical protein
VTSTAVPEHFVGLVDDAAIFPPGNAPLDVAVAEHLKRRDSDLAPFVGPFVVGDLRLAELIDLVDDQDPDEPMDVAVVMSTGAGGLDGVARWADRRGLVDLRGIEIPVLDDADPVSAVRRVDTAYRASGADADVYVELPPTHGDPTHSWLAALDEVAAAGHRAKFRTGGVTADRFPPAGALAAWIREALDREVSFKCTAGLHNAVRHRDPNTGFEHHGFLNVLLATRAVLDGEPPDEVARLLELKDPAAVATAVAALGAAGIASTRRWFTSFGTCDVLDPWEDLVALGLIEGAR